LSTLHALMIEILFY